MCTALKCLQASRTVLAWVFDVAQRNLLKKEKMLDFNRPLVTEDTDRHLKTTLIED